MRRENRKKGEGKKREKQSKEEDKIEETNRTS